MAESDEISSIIEEGPLTGASVPLELWMEINGSVVKPLDWEELDNDTTSE